MGVQEVDPHVEAQAKVKVPLLIGKPQEQVAKLANRSESLDYNLNEGCNF